MKLSNKRGKHVPEKQRLFVCENGNGIKVGAGLNIYYCSLLEEEAVEFQFQELVIPHV